MPQEIVNRVANSNLITLDLEELYPDGKRIKIDISEWLQEGFLLKEKDFRAALKSHDWAQYQSAYVMLYCSTDAILPAWTYILITTFVSPYAKKVIIGSENDLNQVLYQEIIEKLPLKKYNNQKVIIKGCQKKPIPENAYIQLVEKLLPVVQSLMFGEACSTVPLYKKPKL